MYQRILVALSEETAINAKVMQEAIAIAAPSKATLNLLHVLLPPESGYPNPMYMTADGMHSAVNVDTFQLYIGQWQLDQKANQQALDEQANQIQKDHGVATEWTQAVGDPGRQICQIAQDWPADLIVIGRHNRSGISELWIGSVSNYVMHHAGCSVVVVKAASPAIATQG
ncbi:universal stress protein [Leptolyngbya iicbica]|uniref:Universal stress protein n=2 Tax=Cyanophyceae TaxID=3028117 RepID=A0A4Q7EGW8_9CYAN|nr:universal stress protein [Leptolyngbya sp. LK]RZM82595.1 universal stress protein [Leptolyngbya sp. LK]